MIKNLPVTLRRALKKRAEINRRISHEIIATLEGQLRLSPPDVNFILKESDRFRKSLHFTADPDEVDRAKKQRRV